MKSICLILIASLPVLGRADVVLDWNDVTLDVIRRNTTPPPMASRALAMVHVAIYDAVNSVEHTHQHFRVYVPTSADTSREAAAAQAAFRTLLHLYPNERTRLEASLSNSLAAVAETEAKSAGVRLGNVVAERVIAWRNADGSQSPILYRPGTRAGDWRPTPPDYKPALLPQWPFVTPFGIPKASQFRPGFPPSLQSEEYARNLEEVRSLGSVNSSTRTPDQTEIAYFWADGVGTVTPPGHWNRIAQTVTRRTGSSVHENARLFALLNVALADAAIVCWDSKFTCHLWRPVTAIQQASTDGNPATQPDPAWMPLLDTPPFPSCTSGHSTFSGAAAQMLALFFGRDEMQFTDASDSGRGTRSFGSFSQAAEEAGRSRIYGGIHYEFDNQSGLTSGRSAARHIFEHSMQRLSGPATSELAVRSTYRLEPLDQPFSTSLRSGYTQAYPLTTIEPHRYPVTVYPSGSPLPTVSYELGPSYGISTEAILPSPIPTVYEYYPIVGSP